MRYQHSMALLCDTCGLFVQDGINWAGVVMGNLFSRPSATALFVIDGLSSSEFIYCEFFYICVNFYAYFAETSIESLSEMSFDVDQVCSSLFPVISPLTTFRHPERTHRVHLRRHEEDV